MKTRRVKITVTTKYIRSIWNTGETGDINFCLIIYLIVDINNRIKDTWCRYKKACGLNGIEKYLRVGGRVIDKPGLSNG